MAHFRPIQIMVITTGPSQQSLQSLLLEHHPSKRGPDHLLMLGVGRRRRRTAPQTKLASNTQDLIILQDGGPHTWWVRLCWLYACAPPDDPEGLMARLPPTPRMIRGSCSCSPFHQLFSLLGGFPFQSSHR
jgi:hypothetical protein